MPKSQTLKGNGYKDTDIAIIGIAAKFALADNVEEFWINIRDGVDCILECPESRKPDIEKYLDFCNFSPEQRTFRKAAYLEEIDKFDYEFFKITPKEASVMDPNQRLFLQEAYHTLEDGGYAISSPEGESIGVYLGFATEFSGKVYQNLISETCPHLVDDSFSGNLPAIMAARLSYYLNFKGPTVLIDTSCSSSLSAIHLACQGIIHGDCELAIAGGVNIFTIPTINKVVEGIGIMSSDGRAKVFDDSCDGTGNGEGVGTLLLKSANKALRDRDNIHAIIKGTAFNQNGKSIGITAPNAGAQEEVITKAWKTAGINPETISYIEAHGTGTILGDITEISGIKKAFNRYTDKKQSCAIGSVKSNIGHTISSAGVAGVIKAVMALKNKQIPPTIHFERVNRKIKFEDSPVYVNDRLKKWEGDPPRRCGVSSFGISGTNCHVILEEAPDFHGNHPESTSEPQILTLSTQSPDTLPELVGKYRNFLAKDNNAGLSDICYTANTGRRHLNCRLAISVKDKADLIQKLDYLIKTDIGAVESDNRYPNELWLSMNSKTTKSNDSESAEANRQAATLVKEYAASGYNDSRIFRDICRAYANGAEIDWKHLYKTARHRRVSIPTYPFKRIRCWVEIAERPDAALSYADDMYFGTTWELKSPDGRKKTLQDSTVLVFSDSTPLGDSIIEMLKESSCDVIEVNIGPEYIQADNNRYTIENNQSDYNKLIGSIKHRNITKVIHLLTLANPDKPNSLEGLQANLRAGVFSLFYLVKALDSNAVTENIDVILIGKNAYQVVDGDKTVNPHNAAFYGFGKAVKWEYPNLRCRCIDIGRGTTVSNIVSEISANGTEYTVAYRGGQRFTEVVNAVKLSEIEARELNIRSDGAYVILGGMGRIGLRIAGLLSREGKANIALINRSRYPAREEWAGLIKGNGNEAIRNKINDILEMEKTGSNVSIYCADITNYQEIKAVFDDIRTNYGKINGVIQCTVSDDAQRINKMTEEALSSSLTSKIDGTWIIDNITRNDELDFFIMFSSVITLVSGIGNGTYTASNSYLETFASFRNLERKGTLSIGWPEWLNIGLEETKSFSEEKSIFKKILPDKALEVFRNLLHKKLSKVFIGELNYESSVYELIDYMPFNFSEKILAEINRKRKVKRADEAVSTEIHLPVEVKTLGRPDNSYSETEKKLSQAWAKVLGYKEINIFDNFFEIGGDSIAAFKLVVELENHDIIIETPDILNYQTIEKIAQYIENKQPASAATS